MLRIESAPVLPNTVMDELRTAREAAANKLGRARQLDVTIKRGRAAGECTAGMDLELAELVAEIRTDLNAAVDQLETQAGAEWTPGLRAVHFVREFTNARAVLAAQGVIFDRFNFAVSQLAPNETNSPVTPPAVS